jgi:hypothetical protein
MVPNLQFLFAHPHPIKMLCNPFGMKYQKNTVAQSDTRNHVNKRRGHGTQY